MKKIFFFLFSLILGMTLGVPQVQAASYREWLLAAHKGDVVAMRKVGYMQFTGNGPKLDRKNGFAWLKKAADRGDDQAMYYLGRIYETGGYGAVNMKKAVAYYAAAAERGNEKAIRKLDDLKPLTPEAGHGGSTEVAQSESSPKPEVGHDAPAEVAQHAATPENEAATELVRTTPDQGAAAQEQAKSTPPPTPAKLQFAHAKSSESTMTCVSRFITEKAQTSGVESVAVLAFLSNGGRSNALASHLRDSLLEKMLDGGSLAIYDRNDSKLVATEGSLSFSDGKLDAASAVLIGEVFCQPGDDIGYFAYRVFSAKDTRIVAAGYECIRWSRDEQSLFNGAVRQKAAAPLSFIASEELSKLSKIATSVSCGVAMVQDGGVNDQNTVDRRMAYSQIVAELFKRNCQMYEREFMRRGAEEAGLGDATIAPGSGIGAVGHITMKSGQGKQNQLTIKISTVPEGRMLVNTKLDQAKGSAVGNLVGDNAQNEFDDFYDQMDKDARDIKLIYEYEVTLSDQYVIPEWLYDIDEGVAYVRGYDCPMDYYHASFFKDQHAVDVSAMLPMLAKMVYRRTPDKKQVARMLEIYAVFGYGNDDGTRGTKFLYVGPFTLCAMEANRQLRYHSRDWDYKPIDIKSVITGFLREGYSTTAGVMEDNAKFVYKISIEKGKNGLPYKVKCTIDLTPSKDKLFKR